MYDEETVLGRNELPGMWRLGYKSERLTHNNMPENRVSDNRKVIGETSRTGRQTIQERENTENYSQDNGSETYLAERSVIDYNEQA